MNNIVTLTVNPVIDKNTAVNGFCPTDKLNCSRPIYYAGGGGINVSRAIKNLGGTSTALYLAGGRTGNHLENLMNETGISQHVVHIQKLTRENLSVTDMESNLQYRFGMPGPIVTNTEWKLILDLLEKRLQNGDYLVASGKLPPGIPDDFYVRVAKIAKDKKARLVLDTKGNALKEAVKADIFLLKPNLPELATLCGVSSISFSNLETLTKDFLNNHTCEIMVVSLGPQGAFFATRELSQYIPAPIVEQKNKIGAGDSMVAGIVLSLTEGKSLTEMAKYGVACGTAATLRTGTQLCKKEHVGPIYAWISSNT